MGDKTKRKAWKIEYEILKRKYEEQQKELNDLKGIKPVEGKIIAPTKPSNPSTGLTAKILKPVEKKEEPKESVELETEPLPKEEPEPEPKEPQNKKEPYGCGECGNEFEELGDNGTCPYCGVELLSGD